LPITASDSITLAFEHTRQQLFQRFRIGQWTKLAFVGLLAGELGSNGCNRSFFNLPQPPGSTPHPGIPGSLGIDPALLAALGALLAALLISAFAFGIIMMYVSSVMRFVLFDSIVTRECHIRWSWSRRLGAGWRFFVWKLLYVVLTLAGIAIVVGIPVAIAFSQGWFKSPNDHIPALVSYGIVLFLMFAAFAVITAVIFVLTKDFVVPQMALENIDAFEGWRRLWAMMKVEKGAYAGYIGMKIILAIVVGIIIGIATLILGLIIAIPSIGIGVLAFLTGKTAGLTWNAQTITLAIVVGCILLGIFLYLVSLISVPAIVFFPAYSMYFFAGRYPQLHAVLYRSSPAAPVPAGAASYTP
jgi:hypothetical protein